MAQTNHILIKNFKYFTKMFGFFTHLRGLFWILRFSTSWKDYFPVGEVEHALDVACKILCLLNVTKEVEHMLYTNKTSGVCSDTNIVNAQI